MYSSRVFDTMLSDKHKRINIQSPTRNWRMKGWRGLLPWRKGEESEKHWLPVPLWTPKSTSVPCMHWMNELFLHMHTFSSACSVIGSFLQLLHFIGTFIKKYILIFCVSIPMPCVSVRALAHNIAWFLQLGSHFFFFFFSTEK